jgi:hypothetical protein
MKPIYQTKFGKPDGNCFPAAVASILELRLEDVPNCRHENDPEDWDADFQRWLTVQGFFYQETVVRGDPEQKRKIQGHWGYHTIIGRSPTGLFHAVVGFEGKCVHDPHRGWNGELEEPLSYGFFVPLNPAALIIVPEREPFEPPFEDVIVRQKIRI